VEGTAVYTQQLLAAQAAQAVAAPAISQHRIHHQPQVDGAADQQRNQHRQIQEQQLTQVIQAALVQHKVIFQQEVKEQAAVVVAQAVLEAMAVLERQAMAVSVLA
jgi:hypothetical protein